MMKTSLKNQINRLSATQFVILGYFFTIIVATGLLLMPFSRKSGASISFIDALFTATSGVTVTGLTAQNTADTFTVWGHLILLCTFQVGGVGIMALGTFLWMLLGRNISLSYRKLIMIDQNRDSLSGLVRLIRALIVLVLIIEAIGAVIFTVYFYLAGIKETWLSAMYHGVFHSISSYTNAGFDIFGNSLESFSGDYFVQSVTMLLIIFGAIGFPVLLELREYFFGRQKNFRFSLFTKMTTTIFMVLIISGAIGIWLIEAQRFMLGLHWHEQFFYSLFNSVTARSGGLATMDVTEFDTPTQFLMSVMMFIGASPSSVGGGIRTTTFALILLTLFTYALGKTEIRAFHRSIKQEDVIKSFVVFAAGIIIVMMSILIIEVLEPDASLISIIFEVSSAFGTCGLTVGISSEMGAAAKGVLIMLMFIGRIGILSLLFIFRSNRTEPSYHYPKEEIIIG